MLQKPRRAHPLRWVLDRIGSVWFGITLLVLIFVYSSVGSAVPPVRQGQLADWFGLELLRFEKTEMEWFAWWPFQVLVSLFCLSIIVVTLRRIPLTLPNAGVWTVHAGILVTAVACAVYFGTKVEGDTVLFQSRARIRVPGGPETTLVMRPQATAAVAAPAHRYEFQVLEMNPDYTIRSDPGQGQQTQQILIRVTAEPPLSVPELDQPVGSFVRALLVGFPEHTEDVVLTAKGPQRAVKALGTKLLDRDLEITLERDPVAYFYHAHSPPVRSNGALYARFDPRADWTELRLPYLPHYCEHVSDPKELWPSSDGPQPVARPLDIRAAPPAAASELHGLDLRVTDYLPYATLEPRFLKGAEDSPLNPLVHFTLASEQRTESRELLARDPQLHKQPLAEDFDADFAWAESPDERAALLGPPEQPVPGLLIVGGEDRSFVDVVVTGAGGLRERYEAAVGIAFALAPDVNMTIDALWPHAREETRPAITPPARRASLADVGKNASLIRVEINDGHHVTSTWLSFNEYPFTDEQHAQPERFRYAPRSVRLSDGRVLWLLYSRWRERLPDPVALDRFVLRTHPGGDAPSDYVSRVAFEGPAGWTEDVEVRSNRPARHGDLWFFQAKWDPGTEAHTVLGVGNRNGVHAMLAGVLMAIAGMVYAFYVKPVIIRRRQQAALAAATQRHAAAIASVEQQLSASRRAPETTSV